MRCCQQRSEQEYCETPQYESGIVGHRSKRAYGHAVIDCVMLCPVMHRAIGDAHVRASSVGRLRYINTESLSFFHQGLLGRAVMALVSGIDYYAEEIFSNY